MPHTTHISALPISADTVYLLQHRELIAAEVSHQRLLESLYFAEILSRQEGIAQAHKKTFEWIFDKAGNQDRPWYHFVDWLEKGHGTYWISGKAGAGKSTLMSFICQDSRTEVALGVWCGINEVFIPNFFFWNPGTQLQKSLVGLLRSLIYQLVKRFPDLASVVISSMGPTQHGLQQLPTWTEHRLCATLEHLLSNGLEKHCLCIFIDGLDEFDGDYNILLDLVRNLRQSTKVKFCVSSRPYRAFEDEFGSSAMLKLQDLTESDIRRYVFEKLDRAPLKVSKVSHPSFDLGDTVDMIVDKAKGVFLWVNLAVRDQLEGIRNGDDAAQLRERLELLPDEIEELYGHMLQRIDKVYRKEVARYLRLVLINEKIPSLFEIALAVHKRIDDIVLFSLDIAISDIRNHCRFIGTRIATTCKGFLEVQEQVDLHEWQKRMNDPSSYTSEIHWGLNAPLGEDLIETKFYEDCTLVEFLHRTAVDFFNDNEQGKGFLETNAPIYPHPQISCAKARLAHLIIFPARDPFIFDGCEYSFLGKVEENIMNIMHVAHDTEAQTGVAQVALMDLLDHSLAMLCQRSPAQPSNLHWCRAWDLPRCFGNSGRSKLLSSRYPHKSEPKTDSILTPYPVDLLGFAAWSGLHNYVEYVLDSQSGRQNRSTTDYLLNCTVDGLGRKGWRLDSYMKMTLALLKRGANPNLKNSEGTVWGSYLRTLYRLCYGANIASGELGEPFEVSEVLDTGHWGVVREFLGSGANVNEEVCLVLKSSGIYESVAHSSSSGPLRLKVYGISLRVSALSVLRQCFAKTSTLSEIEGTCIAAGALPCFECSELSFDFESEEDPSIWNICWDIKLSKQQLIPFSQTLDQRLREIAENFSKKREIFDRQMVDLIRQLDMEQLFSKQWLQEEVSQEDKCDDDIEEISDESNPSAPDSNTLQKGRISTAPSASAAQTETLPLRTKHDD